MSRGVIVGFSITLAGSGCMDTSGVIASVATFAGLEPAAGKFFVSKGVIRVGVAGAVFSESWAIARRPLTRLLKVSRQRRSAALYRSTHIPPDKLANKKTHQALA